ncbi:MAG: 50S ribosomal protein L4 [Candidatus Paceibacterota bacterium]|jgi:large subunit ribosomal protein L4|nr:50S ribosomal protein L4 [Candidatus Paceibacterota bacterium]
MEAKIYNQTGKSVGTIALPTEVFGAKLNRDLIHQVVVSESGNARNNIAHAKDRSEVRGGGRKPWNQKGGGRARHGSTRSPIWVGGGVTHGPLTEKDYTRKINRKMKAAAMYSILSEKLKNGEIIFVDEVKAKDLKTKEAKEILKSLATIEGCADLATKRKNAAFIALGKKSKETERIFSNIKSVFTGEWRNITPSDLLKYKYIVVSHPEESVAFVVSKMK